MSSADENSPEPFSNDRTYFGKVYDAHYRTIFNFVYRRLLDYELARDITSETFLKAYLHFDRYVDRGKPILAWFYRIASNEVNMYLRKAPYRPSSLNDLMGLNQMGFSESRLAEEERADLLAKTTAHTEFLLIQKELLKLDLDYQLVLSLRYFENKSIREICDILDKKEGTVKSLLSRGLKRLKQISFLTQDDATIDNGNHYRA